VVALASYLDARAAHGRWLVRIEDLDTPRTVAGADRVILKQLNDLGMHWDEQPWYQSARISAYEASFKRLQDMGLIYPCACTRREIADSVLAAHGELTDGQRPYPGTCQQGIKPGRTAKSWRFRTNDTPITFNDRWCGSQTQNVQEQVGDFVVWRSDGIWAYQLAVVVDDAAQNITDIVRGQDLLSSTARQQQLALALGLDLPSVMHVPLVVDERGLKLSKQNGAKAVDTSRPLAALMSAWQHLGLGRAVATDLETFWSWATASWAQRYAPS
jgi:glutamyl-Q tRNA(Asp) synthetase